MTSRSHRRAAVWAAGERAGWPSPGGQGQQHRDDLQAVLGRQPRAPGNTRRGQLLLGDVHADLHPLDTEAAITGHEASSASPSGQ